MTKILVTGEMVNRLKVGEIAECVNVPNNEKLSQKQRQVEINNLGNLEWRDKVDFTVTEFVRREALWKILPNYVSFAEAMKAVEEGKDVHCQYHGESIKIKSYNNRIGSICFDKHCVGGGGAEIKIAWIVSGKWTIRGDK